MNTAKHVNLFQAYKLFWKNYCNFKTSSSRTEYWWAFLWNWLIRLVLLIWALVGYLKTGTGLQFKLGFGLLILYSLAALIPSCSLTVRRYHDAAISGKWILFTYLLPYFLQMGELHFQGKTLTQLALGNGCAFLEFICFICAIILPLLPTKQN